jgi:2-C-methyl-D-erythritol 4-phosphate cytidylyltransferase
MVPVTIYLVTLTDRAQGKKAMKVQAIIPLAGDGARLQATAPKALLRLNAKPMLVHVLAAMDACRSVESCVIATQKKFFKDFERFIRAARVRKPYRLVEGGTTRADSVKRALAVLDADTGIVVIHDGARPLVTPALIDRCVAGAKKNGAVIAAVPVKPTIKRVDVETLSVEATLERSRLWEVQTPQAFKREIICRAYEQDGVSATDDAGLVERLGVSVKVETGDYKNIKITTSEDVMMAELFLTQRRKDAKTQRRKKTIIQAPDFESLRL